jgi:hypothetical protein
MRSGDYQALWKGLSAQTRREIVRSVHGAERKSNPGLNDDAIRRDFERGTAISSLYWAGYLSTFDPQSVLEECRWSMGEVNRDKAVILLRYRQSQKDAHLKLYYEEGGWKVGLCESFSVRW